MDKKFDFILVFADGFDNTVTQKGKANLYLHFKDSQ